VAYDDELAGRVPALLAELTDFEERKMFGGLAFMVNTHMACGIVGDDLMVRVGKDNHDAAVNAGATEMDFTGRPMRGHGHRPRRSCARGRRPGTLDCPSCWVRDPVEARTQTEAERLNPILHRSLSA